MWSRTLAIAVVAVLMVGACTSDAPPLSPPPAPTAATAWPVLGWSEADVPDQPAVGAAVEMTALAVGHAGLVAAGRVDLGPATRGVLWWSADGDAWTAIDDPVLDGLDIVDVAAGAAGYVAIGQSAGPIQTVLLASRDGRSWEAAAPPPGSAEAYGHVVAASDAGFLAAGGDPSVAALWRSPDGRTWEALPGDDVTKQGFSDIAVAGDEWVALVGGRGSATLARSTDGRDWSQEELPDDADALTRTLTPGSHGWLVQGGVGSCGPFGMGSCPEGPASWWSADGTAWGRMPDDPSPALGWGPVAAAGDRGFVAVDGVGVWSSPDGWAWDSMDGPDGSSFLAAAVGVIGDRVVVLGTSGDVDGSRGRVFVGEPE